MGAGAAGPASRARARASPAGAREEGDDPDASLFELPGTHVGHRLGGPARDRARDAFAHPSSRPAAALAFANQALAFVRVDGASLVSHVQQLRGHGALSIVGSKLASALLSLPPGAEHSLRVVLDYADEDAALAAEGVLREVFSALGRIGKKSQPTLAWLGNAKVERTGRSVVATAPLPPELIDALLSASSSMMGPVTVQVSM